MNQQEVQQAEQSQPKQGPGDKLQTARISIGLTLEEVARKMHLSKGILSSLEDNQFEDITAPIFVKGYLRAYSRLVNLNEDDIIEQYSTYYMDGDPPITSTSNTLAEINANNSSVKWITYLIIIGLIALLTFWWWNRYQQEPEKVSLESGNQMQSEVLVADSIEESLSSVEPLALDEKQESLYQEIKTVVDSIQPPAENIANEAVPESNSTLTASSQTEQLEVPDIAVSEDPSITTAEEDAPQQGITEPNLSQDTSAVNDKDLVITVNADTWASIKDATGKKLVYDLLRTGEVISVSGQAPFKAFLGNGYGVSMTYKGKEIDLSSVIQPDNTARIKIGQ